MPSLSLYKKLNSPFTNGEIRKNQSDMIEDFTWWEDRASRVAYLYDWYHDDEEAKLIDLSSSSSKVKIPIDIKYKLNSTQTFSSDQVTFHIELRPHQECNVSYYDEFFKTRYGATFPIGLYIDIPDEKGVFNRWLVVGKANYYATAFPTFEVLPCDYVFRYIVDGVKYEVPCVLRSQSSYNSGIWSDNVFTIPEDQQKMLIPLNRDTEKIYYNLRSIIDNKVLTEPRTWQISKINRIAQNGICDLTFAQSQFNENTDYRDENGIWWADYNSSAITPVDYDDKKTKPTQYSVITYSGVKPEIKVKGGYKKLTVNFFDGDTEIAHQTGVWKFTIDEQDASSIVSVLTNAESTDLDDNQIKVKFLGDSSYIGKILKITFDSLLSSYVEIEIKGL